MVEYFLPHHVHFCWRGDALVFIDLRQDDYILVNDHDTIAFRRLFTNHDDGLGFELPHTMQGLLGAGLLTMDRTAGETVAPTKIQLAMEGLIDTDSILHVNLIASHIWHFLAACTTATVRLSWGRLESTVKNVEQRKTHRASLKPFDMARARELTAIFHKLRSFFPRNYLCLYDSLALIEFLARYDIFPTWVFGVKLEPWAAHCWVQEGPFTFNEGVEEAAHYTPVMVI